MVLKIVIIFYCKRYTSLYMRKLKQEFWDYFDEINIEGKKLLEDNIE